MTYADPIGRHPTHRTKPSPSAVPASVLRDRSAGQTTVSVISWSIVLAAYLLSQADIGIRGDARIYMARLLADLDPQGVGRDVMFLNDGQSAFSLFGLLAKFSAEHLGLANTVQLLSLSATVAWAAAMLVLVRTLRPGSAFALVAAASLLLPRWYTPWHLIGAGEALAIPRPFAEAGALVALALLAQGRLLACAGLLCGSALLHPIMAAPAFGVLFIELVRRDRRWWLAVPAGMGLVTIAAFAKVEIVSRLFVVIDPTWLAILWHRNPYLFLSTWDASSLATEALQIITIAIASTLVDRPFRRLFEAVVLVAILGCVASAILCDGLHLVLVTQLQTWRTLWLTAAFAPVAAGICLWRLPSAGQKGRLALAALVAAWACFELQPIGIAFAAMAAIVWFPSNLVLGRRSIVAIVGLAGLVVCGAFAYNLYLLQDLWRTTPVEMPLPFVLTWRMTMASLVVIALVFLAWARPTRTSRLVLGLGVLPALLIVLALRFDDRTALKKDMDAGLIKADLVTLMQSRRGDVLWIGGDELWYWTRRANWSNPLHGAGIVFSRDLALLWQDRASALVSHGLAHDGYINPWKVISAPPLPHYDRAALADFCRRADAPAWIILPMTDATLTPPDPNVKVWMSSFKEAAVFVDHGDPVVRTITHRLVVPCH